MTTIQTNTELQLSGQTPLWHLNVGDHQGFSTSICLNSLCGVSHSLSPDVQFYHNQRVRDQSQGTEGQDLGPLDENVWRKHEDIWRTSGYWAVPAALTEHRAKRRFLSLRFTERLWKHRFHHPVTLTISSSTSNTQHPWAPCSYIYF